MTKESNLQCPYKFIANPETQSYNFTTVNNIVYKVAFIDGSESYSNSNNLNKIYFISIDNESDIKPPKDYRVQLTIESILTAFFKDKENVLLYICDAMDNRQYKRHSLFDRWYNASALKSNVNKIDSEIPDNNQKQYVSLLYHVENPFKQELENEHAEMIYSLVEGK